MLQQQGNPPSKPASKDSDDLIARIQEATASLKKFTETIKGSGRIWQGAQEKVLMQSQLVRLLMNIIPLESRMDEAAKRDPKVDNLKSQLASAKTDLENFLKEHNLKVSYEELKHEVLHPRKWWQLWRLRAAADLLRSP